MMPMILIKSTIPHIEDLTLCLQTLYIADFLNTYNIIMIFKITNEYIIEFQYNRNHDSGPLINICLDVIYSASVNLKIFMTKNDN